MADVPRPPERISADADELVNAVLDGEATAAEVEQVRSDPTLAARLEGVRRAASALADPPPPLDEDQRRALLDRALAAAGQDTDPSAVVAPLAPRRRSRRLPPAPLVAAAVIVLVVVGLALILTGRADRTSSASKQSTSESFDQATGKADARSGGLNPDGTNGAAGSQGPHVQEVNPTTSATGGGQTTLPLSYLGTFADAEQLRVALSGLDPRTLRPAQALTPPDSAGTYTDTQLQRCAQVPRGFEQQLGQPLAYAYAGVNGDAVVVISFSLTDQPGKVREIALGQGCTVPLLGIDR